MNIDNIELFTGIDIPKVKKCDCKYNRINNTKRIIFYIDTSTITFDNFISHNNFQPVTVMDENTLMDIFVDEKNNYDSNYLQGKLLQVSENKNCKWKALIDRIAGKLYMTIQYKD